MESENSISLNAQCYCKSLHFTLTLPTSALPLSVHLCHCSVCRYTHGTMCIFHAPLPANVAPQFVTPSGLDKLTAYTWPGGKGIRYFCSTCGCHMGDVSPDDGTWVISTSFFAKDESIFQIKTHVFTESALGGGLNDWLPQIGNRKMKTWNPDDGSAVPVQPQIEHGADGQEDRLRAQCHCGGVSFTIPRPNKEVLTNPAMKSFVSPIDKTKWVACLDMCDDCRLTTGSHLVAWTFIPLDQCEPKIKPDLLIGTSKTFRSSTDVLRSFCGQCGATVFFSYAKEAKNIADVAVGILRAPEGVKAENWLTWRTGRIAWYKSGLRYDEALAMSLSQGLADWGMVKYGQNLDFEIGS
ncbi:Mss4-like protein [Talaromyces proteolyticus]|uniref:Mss4-like protein n=1 Tax=Talaromyces proteolyticus TaxID=1131652 RepID=A0AAD4PUG6_9EURO|nr:Mss4-like protein [Talaromyces proteolyticus]KAH8689355.1 Mss4-like protein [Talaromyces proteolyticus]